MESLLQHRSVRQFKVTPIEPELIDSILEAGIRAANTGNMQAYSIVVTTEADLLAQLSPCHFNQPASKAPVQLTFCADFNRFTKWCRQRQAKAEYDNFLSFFTSATDALLAAQNICIAAEEKGLGTCYMGTTVYNAEKIIDILRLPHGVVPVLSLVMGYPDGNAPLTDRLPLPAVVHYEVYKDYTPDDIDQLYAHREASEQTAQLLAANKKETLAQIFTDIRYTKIMFDDISRSFLNLLHKQGFMNQ